MKKLIQRLNQANNEYYNFGESSLSDLEYDFLLQKLKEMEQKTGIVYGNSPTFKVGYPVLNKLNKIKITDKPMLSLQKTKDEKELFLFKQKNKVLGMIKCDGLSVRIIYVDGKLSLAHTRGDGYIGGDITEHIKTFSNVPLTIPYKGKYIIDGEAIIKTDVFNELLKNYQYNFSNSRNAACGSLNLLNIEEVKKRQLSFIAWDVIKGDLSNSLKDNLLQAQQYGFEIVYFTDDINVTNQNIQKKAKELNIPCDGIVWKYDDINFYTSLGATEHHCLGAIAFKFYDEIYRTILRDIEWSMGRTSVLTPIAIFDEVDIDGSRVSRASLHNVSVMRDTLGTPWVGHLIDVCKMNMIIPQIQKNEELNAEVLGPEIPLPTICPVCGGEVKLEETDNSLVLKCMNPTCQGKLINRLDHFTGKKGLDIVGLSKATLEKLIDWGWVNSLIDIFKLEEHKAEWMQKSGFGTASVTKLLAAIENSKTTTLDKFISSLGIPLIGSRMAKIIAARVYDYGEFRDLIIDKFDFSQWEGFADSKTDALLNFDYTEADELYHYMKIEVNEPVESKNLDLTVCITGSLEQYKNRAEMQAAIEAAGGKVVGSISKKVNYLINNDLTSGSSKNLKAKELNIPIISEADFIQKFLK